MSNAKVDNTLCDFVSLQRGTTYKSALLDQPDPMLLGLASIQRDGGFRSEKLRTYGGDSPQKLLSYPGDIYVSLKDVTQSGDLLGSVSRVPETIDIGRLTQDTVKLVFKDKVIPRAYIYWLLRTPQYRQYCRSRGMGTTNLSLSRGDFLSFSVPVITSKQRLLLSTLEDLEEKIELNRRMNRTLEAITQAIFKSWFVNFEPVRAKQQAKATGESVELAAMMALSGKSAAEIEQLSAAQRTSLAETAALFPEQLVNSELWLIPEGWEVSDFQDIAIIIMGQSPKGDTYNDNGEGTLLVNGPVEFGTYFTQKSKWTTTPTKLALPGDLIVCVRGSTTGRFVISDDEYCLGRGVCAIRGENSQVFASYTFKHHKKRLLEMATGSTFPSWSSKTLKEFNVVNPGPDLIRKFDFYVHPMVKTADKNIHISAILLQLRDTLLPKLLSGELTIPDAIAQTEEALS